MRNNDSNATKRATGQADPARDAHGRWAKGYCPNPHGRPRKKPEQYLDQTDIRIFAETPIEVKTDDGVKVMSRRAALYQRMFDDAMRGKVSNQRFFFDEFARSDENLAELHLRYQQTMDWVEERRKKTSASYEKIITPEIRSEISRLEQVLSNYFPKEPAGGSDDGD